MAVVYSNTNLIATHNNIIYINSQPTIGLPMYTRDISLLPYTADIDGYRGLSIGRSVKATPM